MRDYGKIEVPFWSWARRNKLSDHAKLLAVYLLTNRFSNSVGCYELFEDDICTDLKWSEETVSKTLMELFENHSGEPFAYYCKTTEYVFIRDHLRHNPPANGNVAKAMGKIIHGVPRRFSYWPELIDKLKPFEERFPNGFINGLAKRFLNQEQEQEHKQEEDNTTTTIPSISANAPDEAPPVVVVLPEGSGEQSINPEDDPFYIPPSLRRVEGDKEKPAPLRRRTRLEDQFDTSQPLTDHPGKPVCEAYMAVVGEVFGTEHLLTHAGHGGSMIAARWLEAGADLALCREVFATVLQTMKDKGRQPPNSLNYFEQPIADAIAAAAAPMPQGHAGNGAKGPVVSTHPDSETNRWRGRIMGFQQNEGFWLDSYGPEPTQPGCMCPQDILEAFGYGRKEKSNDL